MMNVLQDILLNDIFQNRILHDRYSKDLEILIDGVIEETRPNDRKSCYSNDS